MMSHLNSDYYGELTKQFGSIALQMGNVELHLENIKNSLSDIEDVLEKALQAEDRVDFCDETQNHKKFVKKVTYRAKELIDVCDKYFSLIKSVPRALQIK